MQKWGRYRKLKRWKKTRFDLSYSSYDVSLYLSFIFQDWKIFLIPEPFWKKSAHIELWILPNKQRKFRTRWTIGNSMSTMLIKTSPSLVDHIGICWRSTRQHMMEALTLTYIILYLPFLEYAVIGIFVSNPGNGRTQIWNSESDMNFIRLYRFFLSSSHRVGPSLGLWTLHFQ